MLDSLINLFTEFLDIFRFWIIVDEFESGIVLRLGRFHREIGPGPHWKLFVLDAEHITNTNDNTTEVRSQTITTKDRKEITVTPVIKWRVKDAKAYILNVWKAKDTLKDVILMATKSQIKEHTYEELVHGSNVERKVLDKIRRDVAEYGIKVRSFVFADEANIKALRILMTNSDSDIDEDE